VVVARLLKVADLCPFVLGDVIHFTFLGGLIGVLRADCVDEVFGFELEFTVEVCELMARASIVHESALLDLVGAFVDHVAFVGENRPDIIFFFLSADKEYFVLRLNRCKLLRQYIMVSDRDLHRRLCIQLMYEQTLLFLVVIVQPWFYRSKDVVWLKANNVMQESSEFVYFALNLDEGTRILLDKVDVRHNFVLKVFILHVEIIDHVLLLKDLQELLTVVEVIKIRNSGVNIFLKAL
jgi:hypothetical protein